MIQFLDGVRIDWFSSCYPYKFQLTSFLFVVVVVAAHELDSYSCRFWSTNVNVHGVCGSIVTEYGIVIAMYISG